ncbi:MAG TPA: hypothetical protein PK054_01925 [Anaerohalosphaeraceae bacterium]|nr:hypothetical protein [Anaerohalosphaeraceae bacterium]HOL88071.1 hypothetical protein [Anaerohalosphaeraceae bacterium]HPP55319.1 hypothetical protein [Anaerohalosphaeraceae bacterium]
MNALLKKLAVLCLVLVLASASWAGCCKGKSDDSACGDNKKACEKKDKECKEENKSDCQKDKGEAASSDKAA